MWPKLIDCLESDSNIKTKLSHLNIVINVHGSHLEGESEITLVKAKVKELCADVTKRTEGLLLLYAVVHCNPAVYVDNWSQIVLGSLKCPDTIIPREIPLTVLNRMLINFGSVSDYSDVFSKVITDILPIILNPEDDDKIYILSCQSLAVCMRYAPKVAGINLAGIEKLLLKELDNPYGEVIEAIGEGFAALPMCVPKAGPSEYKEMWCNIFTKIMNTTHSLLNNIMKLSEDQAEFVNVSVLPVFHIPSDSNNPVVQINIFKSLTLCLARMMSSQNRLVRLPITELLNTLFRVFSVEQKIKVQNQDEYVEYLKLGFPQMLNGVYVVLEALILNFKILEQGHNFVALMKKSLSAMEEIYLQSSSVSQVRGSTWKLINVWLKQYGTKGSSAICKEKYIIQELLKDIDLEEPENGKSKRLKTNNVEEKNQKANKAFVCTHALKVLKSLIECGVGFIEKSYIDKICSALLRTAKISLRHTMTKKCIPFPYNEERCRKMLFDALCTYAIYSDPLHSKCIMETQNICNAASRDPSMKVSRLCHRFRKESRHYLNPRKPPPEAVQNSSADTPITVPDSVTDNLRVEWGPEIDWNSANGPANDDHRDDCEVTQVHEEREYSDKSESDLVPIEQMEEESESRMNNQYRKVTKQTSQPGGEEESVGDSDIEPTYDSNPQRIGVNDSSQINSFGMQPCGEQYANDTRNGRHVSEAVVPNLANSVENDVEEHVSAFVEVKSAGQKPTQVPMGNGEWKKRDNMNESSCSEDTDMEEEGDEEADANEEGSDNGDDEASDGKRSPEFDEERPRKRQRCMDEEEDEEIDEELEDEEITINNQSDEEEGNGINNVHVMEHDVETTENLVDEESQDGTEERNCKSPTIRQMCGDFVLAEPSAPDIS